MMFMLRNHTANATSSAAASCACATMNTAIIMDTILVSIFVVLAGIIRLPVLVFVGISLITLIIEVSDKQAHRGKSFPI